MSEEVSRQFVESFDDAEAAWQVAFEIAETMKEFGITGRMVSVRQITRHMWWCEMVTRVQVPEQRGPSES